MLNSKQYSLHKPGVAMKSFSRRDMLRFSAAGLGSLLVPAGMRTIVSAAEATAVLEKVPSPAKEDHKIKPPKSGCYVGFLD